MKKIIIIITCVLTSIILLSGCAKKVTEENPVKSEAPKVETQVTSANSPQETPRVEEKVELKEEKKENSTSTETKTNSTSSNTTSTKTAETKPAPSATTAPKPTTKSAPSPAPAPTPAPAPVKPSGIDWTLTNTIRSYKGFSGMMYANGKYKGTFDQYLLDIVQGKMMPAQVEQKIKSMSGWTETSVFPGVQGDVVYITNDGPFGNFHYGTTTSDSNDPEMLASLSKSEFNALGGEYKQVIVVYNADTKKNTVHSMTVKFAYTVPIK